MAAVAATAGVTGVVVAVAWSRVSHLVECCPIGGARSADPQARREAQRLLERAPGIPEEAPTIRGYLRGGGAPSFWDRFCLPRGPFRLCLSGDVLLVGRRPGRAEDAVPLAGAQVVAQGAIVLLTPRVLPAATLVFNSASQAAEWCGKFSQRAAPQPPPLPGVAPAAQPAECARIAELESRVNATLRAAVDRAARIRELEAAVQEGGDKEQRIKQLELKVEATSAEARARAERIRELEAALENGGCVRDAAADAMLLDAMQFAEGMLRDREELVGDTSKLREAVDAVKETKPAVDRQVAELIRSLVTALRWPLALQQRLADAERTMQAQRALQDRTEAELGEVRQRRADEEAERWKAQAEVTKLTSQLAVAEQAVVEASERAQELERKGGEQLAMLKDQNEVEAGMRDAAEEKARELRSRLIDAERAVEALTAKQQQKELEDVRAAQQLDELRAKSAEAERSAEQLRQVLAEAEQAADDALAQQKGVMEAYHAEELRKVHELGAVAELQKSQAEVQAQALRRQLDDAERAVEESMLRQRERLADEHGREIQELRQQHDVAERLRAEAQEEAAQLRLSFDAAQEVARERADQQEALRTLQEHHSESERRRSKAEADAKELRRLLEEARRGSDAALLQQKDELEQLREEDLRRVREEQRRAVAAEAERLARDRQRLEALAPYEEELGRLQRVLAEADARNASAERSAEDLARRLAAAERASSEAALQAREELDAKHQEELRKVRLRYAATEASLDQERARADELKEYIANAEAAMGESAARRMKLLDGEALGTPRRGRGGDAAAGEAAAASPRSPEDTFTELNHRLAAAERAVEQLKEPPPYFINLSGAGAPGSPAAGSASPASRPAASPTAALAASAAAPASPTAAAPASPTAAVPVSPTAAAAPTAAAPPSRAPALPALRQRASPTRQRTSPVRQRGSPTHAAARGGAPPPRSGVPPQPQARASVQGTSSPRPGAAAARAPAQTPVPVPKWR